MWRVTKGKIWGLLALFLGLCSISGCLADGASFRHPFGKPSSSKQGVRSVNSVDEWIEQPRPGL